MTSLSLRAAAGKKKSAPTPPSSTPPAPAAARSKSNRNGKPKKAPVPQSTKSTNKPKPNHPRRPNQQQTQPKEQKQQQHGQNQKRSKEKEKEEEEEEESIQSTPLSYFAQIPPPWTMCSLSEGRERSRLSMELSEFEYIPDHSCSSSSLPQASSSSPLQSYTRSRNKQKVEAHAQLCIQKYRRSAAGGGVTTTTTTLAEQKRSLQDLVWTVNYLLGRIVPFRCVTLTTTTPKWWECQNKVKSLSTTANFVEDRLRAVQVDLVPYFDNASFATEMTEKRKMMLQIQARIVRYHILFLHLLSNVHSEKYEMKFGVRALHTALSCYFDLASSSSSSYSFSSSLDESERNQLDEIMSYEALLHISSIIRQRELALPTVSSGSLAENMSEYGSGYTAILLSYKRFQHLSSSSSSSSSIRELYPKWSFALQIATSADMGNYNKLLQLLSFTYGGDAKKKQGSSTLEKDEERWQILFRCCIAKSLNVIRIGAIRQYNKCFGKKEEVLGDDLAKLLHLPDANTAIQFCQHVGLPTEISSKKESPSDGHHNCVIMKAAPISITDPNAIQLMDNPGRCEDLFVFGKKCLEEDWKEDNFLTGVNDGDGRGRGRSNDHWESDNNGGHGSNNSNKDISKNSKQTKGDNDADDDDDWEERDWDQDLTNLSKQIDEMSLLSTSETSTKNRITGKLHLDQEGVVVPPDYALWSIIK